MNVTHLECANCHKEHEANKLQNLCGECGKPLLVRYDLAKASETLTKESLTNREANLWRYREVLPVENEENIICLGEGWTPLLRTKTLAETLSVKLNLYIKDESTNPTQSFKARGMSAAVSMAKELGVNKVAAPSAGNAAGALAAYASRAGMETFLFMPKDTPRANVVECEQTGANVTLVDGLITDCATTAPRFSNRLKPNGFSPDIVNCPTSGNGGSMPLSSTKLNVWVSGINGTRHRGSFNRLIAGFNSA